MEISREQFRVLIYYDFKSGLHEDECLERLATAFESSHPSRATIYRWYREFKRGGSSVSDKERDGRPRTGVTPENVEKVRLMVRDDPHISYEYIQKSLQVSSDTVSKILHEELRMKKVVCRWVPHSLTQFQKDERVRISRQTLQMLSEGGQRLISKIVTGDETYIPFYDTPTRQESRVWIHEDDPTPTTVKKQRSMKKVMYAVFFRSTGLVKAVKLEDQRTVTANWYTEVCLPEVLKELRIRGLMLHHDNASSHTAKKTVEYLQTHGVQVVEHPPYSPDLAMCDFWLFFKLKKHLRGRRFLTEEEIHEAIMDFFDSLTENDWRGAFEEWKVRLQKCIDVSGDYFEHL